jgi:hypothetical protein
MLRKAFNQKIVKCKFMQKNEGKALPLYQEGVGGCVKNK